MVNNEVSPLKKVVVHRPDDGLQRVTPDKALEFLYDDITYLPEMQKEHDIFTDTIRTVIGEDGVIETQDMLLDILRNNAAAKAQLIQEVVEHETLAEEIEQEIKYLSAKDLAYLMFNGVNPKNGAEFFAPLPNYVFTRDIGVVINDHLLICQAATKARSRENIISSCFFHHHKEFRSFWSENKIIDITDEPDDITVEGGDVMVISPTHVLIGASERTTHKAIQRITELLFEKEVIDNVVTVEIPDERSYMHIDTVFTQISETEFVAFNKLMMDDQKVKFTVHNKNGSIEIYKDLLEFLQSVIPEVVVIECGNGISPHDEREQWTDGCNLVTLRPGLAIAYARNTFTADALQDKGYTIMRAETFLKLNKDGDLNVEDLGKFIFTIPSAELSRARGGPHCMTFPVKRG
ncbi:MAG: arginine deiminase [Saprospiraceae bacterium]|nr:arginine deiminase [Saprospiraceae bacterium]